MNLTQEQNPVIIFDGVCNLCSGAVAFVVKRDSEARYEFAAFQSEAAKELICQFRCYSDDIDSIILVEDGNCYYKSTAVLRILRQMGALWSLTYIFILIPKRARDYIYDILAKNRYGWFGKKDACMVPSDDIKNRFLN